MIPPPLRGAKVFLATESTEGTEQNSFLFSVFSVDSVALKLRIDDEKIKAGHF
jgi:hypothetical protein